MQWVSRFLMECSISHWRYFERLLQNGTKIIPKAVGLWMFPTLIIARPACSGGHVFCWNVSYEYSAGCCLQVWGLQHEASGHTHTGGRWQILCSMVWHLNDYCSPYILSYAREVGSLVKATLPEPADKCQCQELSTPWTLCPAPPLSVPERRSRRDPTPLACDNIVACQAIPVHVF